MSIGRGRAHGIGTIALIALVWLGGGTSLASGPRAREVQADASAPALPEAIGERGTGLIAGDETLLDVAERNHVGFEALIRLNPDIDVWMPPRGTKLALPTQMIPPRAPRSGIVLNLPEMRLYDYTQGPEAQVFPIAIGAADTPSPVGDLQIEWKTIEPVWRVPASIRAVDPDLPLEVPPGPNNPLGRHWLGIGRGYGIHGTNNRWSIGRLATHGCIRLSNADIADLYARVPVGSRVRILYQTVKLGRSGDDLLVEAHPDIYGRGSESIEDVLSELERLGLLDYVARDDLASALAEARGIPLRIGTLPRDARQKE
jgi:L,D-transpeptidase ErfK/SrfK